MIDPRELMGRFESLGNNCEFGFVQRRAGIEPLGLLRWIGLGAGELSAGNSAACLPILVHALQSELSGIDDPQQVEIESPLPDDKWQEYFVRNRLFDMKGHTNRYAYRIDVAEAHTQVVRTLRYLRQKLLRDLKEASKIFVYRTDADHSLDEMTRLLQAIRSHGNGTLLWVTAGDPGFGIGSVEVLGDGFLKGHLDRFAPPSQTYEVSFDAWLTVCRNAAALTPDLPVR
jgi:hypothetical protein